MCLEYIINLRINLFFLKYVCLCIWYFLKYGILKYYILMYKILYIVLDIDLKYKCISLFLLL